MSSPILWVAAFVICSVVTSHAGGPAFIAGSGYDPAVEGQPLLWASGTVQYFTDQGDLSPILPGAQADAFVATAFGTWTTVAGVALTASSGGHLAEDVNGGNMASDGLGTITAPADITSTATGTPIGIVYDYDGTVTDALIGQGARDPADCFTNAVYGGPDNFSTSGNIVHAVVVINGVCASTSAQLHDVQYRLVRVLSRTLGLGWSQANLNVLTHQPAPTSADFAGFPVMHFTDPVSCVPISTCYPNAAVPKAKAEILRPPNQPSTRLLAQLPTSSPPPDHRDRATKTQAKVRPVDNLAATRLLADKRSCRFAQHENGLPVHLRTANDE